MISAPPALAQKVTVSEEINIRSDDHFSIIGSINNITVLLTIKGQQLELHAYDEDVRLRTSVEVDILQRNSRMISSVKGNSSFLLFSQKREGPDIDLIYWEYNNQLQLIDSTVFATASQLFGYSPFYSVLSEDFSKILFFRSDNNTNLQILCFDLNEKKVTWNQNIQINGNLRQEFRQMLVTNSGEMVLVLEKRERGFRRSGTTYEFKFINTNMDLTAQSIDLTDKLSSSAKFVIDNNNRRVSGGGIYYERNSTRAEGQFICYLYLDETLTYHFSEHPFTVEILANFSERNINRGAITELEIRDIKLRKDGGLVLFSEIKKIYERRPTYTQRGWNRNIGQSVWTDYHLEDVLITAYHPDGLQHWFEVLYKKQNSQDDGAVYSSYFIFETPSFIRLIYNDEISGNNTVSEYLVAANGYSERKTVMNTEYQNLKLMFRDAYQKSSNEVVVPSETKSRLRLVRIRY